MKRFSSFLDQLDEALVGVAPKAKGEHRFVHSTFLNQIKDPGDLEKVGPEEIGPHDTKAGSGKRPLDRLNNKQKFGESVDLEENYRALAQKGIGAERKQDIKVGHGVDYYHPKDGSKHMGKIHDMDDKGYTVKDDKTGEKHKFDYFRKEEVEHVEEGRGAYDELASRMGTSSPGFNKTPAGKAREQRRRQEHLKGQMKFTQRMGGLTGPKSKLPEEVEQVDELKKSTLQSYYKKSAEDEVQKGYERSYHDGDSSAHAKSEKGRLDHEMEKRRAGQYSVTHRLGSKATSAMDKKMGHTVKIKPNQIPPNKKKYSEEVELDEADFSKSQTTMAHAIGKHFKSKGIGDESKGGPFAVASAMVRDKPEAAKKAYVTIKAKMKNEDSQDALMSLYDDLNKDNQVLFMEMLEEDAEKLLTFAKSRVETDGEE